MESSKIYYPVDVHCITLSYVIEQKETVKQMMLEDPVATKQCLPKVLRKLLKMDRFPSEQEVDDITYVMWMDEKTAKNIIYINNDETANNEIITDDDLYTKLAYLSARMGLKPLLQYYIEVKNANIEPYNVLLLSSEGNNIETFKYFYEKEEKNIDVRDLEYVLNLSIENGFPDIFNYIMSKGFENMEYILETASEFGNIEIAKYAIDKGARNLNEGLEFASQNYDLDMIKFLVKRGADNINNLNRALSIVSNKDIDHYPGRAKFILLKKIKDVIKFLVESGANDLDDALKFSMKHYDLGMVKYLVEKGADRIKAREFYFLEKWSF